MARALSLDFHSISVKSIGFLREITWIMFCLYIIKIWKESNHSFCELGDCSVPLLACFLRRWRFKAIFDEYFLIQVSKGHPNAFWFFLLLFLYFLFFPYLSSTTSIVFANYSSIFLFSLSFLLSSDIRFWLISLIFSSSSESYRHFWA